MPGSTGGTDMDMDRVMNSSIDEKRDLILLIDMQNVYRIGQPWECCNIDKAIGSIIKLIDAAEKSSDIVLTRYIASSEPEGVWRQYNEVNREINEDVIANELIDELKPYSGRFSIYDKSKYSSLSVPEIKQLAQKAKRVVLTGVVAECCVMFTAVELIEAGIPVVYITDAVAGANAETEQSVITALEGLSPLHIQFMTADDYINEQ